jgi:two-component system chemotaxis sensor kinase CheA
VQLGSSNQSILLQEYLEDSEDLINEIEQILLDLEKNGSQDHLLDCLMRTLHSFKGSAQLMGLEPIVSVLHGMETLISRFRIQDDNSCSDLAGLCYDCIDVLRDLAGELSISGACTHDISPVLQKIDKLVSV